MKKLYTLSLILTFMALSMVSFAQAQCLATWTSKADSANKFKIWFTANNTSSDFYYKWSFGDGTYSDNRTPNHTYNSSGKFRICLYVIKKDSTCSNLVCDSIMVAPNSPPPCLGTWTSKADSSNGLKKFFFANNTSSDFLYKWSFGDGTFSENRTPNHVWQTAGKYKVCLTVTKKDSTCSITVCDSISVGNAPIVCLATWNAKPDSANKLKWFFNANNTSSDYNYKWYFGDGTSSELRTPFHVYQSPGKYKICLSVIRKDSACMNYVCDSIVIGENNIPCNANWSSKPDSANKLKWYFTADNTSGDFTIRWSFGDNTYSEIRTPVHTYAAAGTYSVCILVSKKDSSCTVYKCMNIVVGANNAPCNAGWSFKTDSINKLKAYFNAATNSTLYNYKWTFGDGTSSDNSTPTHVYTKAGKFRVCLKLTRKDSTCTLEKCDSIQINQSAGCEAGFSVSASGRELRFTNTSAGGYNKVKWGFGDNTYSDMINPVHLYTQNGTYTVCLMIYRIEGSDTLCSSKKCVTLTVAQANSQCIASFSREINTNQRKISFTNTSTGSNLLSFWTFGDDSFSTTTNPVHFYARNGVYRICLYVVNQNDTSCRSVYCRKDSVIRKDSMANQATASAQFAYISYNPFQRSLQFDNHSNGNALSYAWDFGDGESSEEANPVHAFADDAWYLVCLKAYNAGSSDTYCENVHPDFATGINTIKTDASKITVFPNPFGDRLNITSPTSEQGIQHVKIVDMKGQVILTYDTNSAQGEQEIHLNTTELSKGIYFINILTHDEVITRKLVK